MNATSQLVKVTIVGYIELDDDDGNHCKAMHTVGCLIEGLGGVDPEDCVGIIEDWLAPSA